MPNKRLIDDPDFLKLSREGKRAALLELEPDFARLSPQGQDEFLTFVSGEVETVSPPSYIEPIAREAVLGAASGLGIPEKVTSIGDGPQGQIVEYLRTTATDLAKGMIEPFQDWRNYIPVYGPARLAAKTGAGLVQHVGGFAKEIAEAAPALSQLTPGGGLLTGQLPPPEEIAKAAHGVAGLATTALAFGRYGKKPSPSKTLAATKAGGRIAVQEIVGAGREPVLLARIKREATVAERQRAFGEVETKYKTERAKTEQAHAQKTTEWLEENKRIEGLQQESDRISALKEATESHLLPRYQRLIDKNIKTTHAKVRTDLGRRWDELRSKVGAEAQVDSEPVYKAIRQAEKDYLRGSPESLKQFRELVGETGIRQDIPAPLEKAMFTKAGTPAVPAEVLEQIYGKAKAMDFQTARTHYTALGDKLYSGSVPGNVYKALEHVQNILDQQISRTVSTKGMGGTYQKLKADWSQYMKDWNDMRATALGGSPLAKALRVQDLPILAQQLTGKASQRLVATLARYKQYGATPEAIARYQGVITQTEKLPKVRVPKLPEKPELILPTTPTMEPLPPPVDPAAVRRNLLLIDAGRPIHWYDWVIPFYGAKRAWLKFGKGAAARRERIAVQPRKELEIPPPSSLE